MRDGEIWFYQASEFFSTLTDLNNIDYRGFDRINTSGNYFTCGVFEFSSNVIFTADFVSRVQSYQSDKILCMYVFESISFYKHCVIVLLRK